MTLGLQPAHDPAPPSALETALTERTCSIGLHAVLTDPDSHSQCVAAQLTSLRADFGQDLRRLTAAERKALDSACSRINSAASHDAYLDCLNARLVALKLRRTKTARARTEQAPAAAPVPAPPAPIEPPPERAAPRSAVVISGVAITIAVAATTVLVVVRRRRARRRCRTCGTFITGSGDLCAACRREAADTLRRAAAERAAEQRAVEESDRRKRAREEEEREKRTRAEEDARIRLVEEARRRAQEARQRVEEEAARRSQQAAAAAVEHAFDPYAVLGVARDAGPDAVRAAYEAAKQKYGLDTVSHLGIDVQEYYKSKAEEAARAYQMIAGG
jgi:hypothetical protein